MRRFSLRAALLAASLMSAGSIAAPAWCQDGVNDAWADFNHYVLVARPDLAAAAGQQLLDADNTELLAAVESGDYANWQETVSQAQRLEGVADVANQVADKVQQARIDVARDPNRIAADIAALSNSRRAYSNAVQRLAAAGQYATPAMLEALQDPDRTALQPFILSAFEEIGRPVAYPLAVALGDLSTPTIEQVAQVLATIGYPDVAPYIKAAIETKPLDPQTKSVLTTALNRLAERSRMDADVSASAMFLALAEAQYDGASADQPGYDDAEQVGLLWRYGPEIGLVSVAVPAEIYPDTLAMDSTKASLGLDDANTPALELYLAANLRRENRLPDGMTDPSYPLDAQPAAYYARLAGPAPVMAVLDRALTDRDPALALDAIDVLGEVAGTQALVSDDAASDSLLMALGSPDRRVRFAAAMTLGQARPQDAFDGSFRVVPTLAEAVRQGDALYAVALAGTQDRVNALIDQLDALGYTTIGATTVSDLSAEADAIPGIDLIAVAGPVDTVTQLIKTTQGDYRLGSAPVVALVSADGQAQMAEFADDLPRVSVGLDSDDPATLDAAVQAATSAPGTEPIGLDEGTDLAVAALDLLRELAEERQAVYQLSDAQPVLVTALGDNRPEIMIGSANILALLNDSAAQQAIARAALDAGGLDQVDLLGALAESARHHGNLLDSNLQDRVADLINGSTGDLAEAASMVYGALGLPTSVSAEQVLAD
ncbi:MAG: HEAT repeat domain-containing protein [Planctomycetota bacterium]